MIYQVASIDPETGVGCRRWQTHQECAFLILYFSVGYGYIQRLGTVFATVTLDTGSTVVWPGSAPGMYRLRQRCRF
jgi:hypothetical protein